MAERLLMVLPSVVKELEGELEIDIDFSETVRSYLDSFETVVVACPVTRDFQDSGLRRSRRLKDLPWGRRLEFIPLPNAYGVTAFFRQYATVKRLLKRQIKSAVYLVFSPHTLVGDWPTVAVREAVKLQRPYVIEADVVYESLAELGFDRTVPWKRFIKRDILLPMFRRSYRYCLQHSNLALFQGQDVFDAYAKFCSNPHNMHYHIPIYKGDHITEAQLQVKLDRLENGAPIKICYAGRAFAMKGPIDWLDVLGELTRRDVKLTATWVGEGSLLPIMRERARELGIADRVSFPGFVSDRREILRTLRDSDIFLFCHKTLESARVLGEALACGCPLVGYAGAYPEELVSQHGGGRFVKLGEWEELAEIIQALDNDRDSLRKLIRSASASGRLHEREAAMQSRIDLIKEYLNPANGCASSMSSTQREN